MGNTWISRTIVFHPAALKEYKSLKKSHNTESIKRIWELLFDIDKNGNMNGIGSPERLRYDDKLLGWYSRKINDFDRLVYNSDIGSINIKKCKGHYDTDNK